MTGPDMEQLLDVQNRLNALADEGAVGLLSKMDVALISWALGYATGGVVKGIRSPRAPKTEAERTALNALHRWLHSPAGDGELTEAAQDYHQQVEVECPEDCERLETEERFKWAQLRRGEAET